jgi:hypothetical protein
MYVKNNIIHALLRMQHIRIRISLSILCSVNVCEEERELWRSHSLHFLKNRTYTLLQSTWQNVRASLSYITWTVREIPSLRFPKHSLRREKNIISRSTSKLLPMLSDFNRCGEATLKKISLH